MSDLRGVYETYGTLTTHGDGFAAYYDPEDTEQTEVTLKRLRAFYGQLGYEFLASMSEDGGLAYALREIIHDERLAEPVKSMVQNVGLPLINPGEFIWTSYVTGLTVGILPADLLAVTTKGQQLEDPDQLELDLGL